MKYRLTILGCGSSTGVPSIENGGGKCDPSQSKNHRTRTSAFLEISDLISPQEKFNILFDTSPDFKEQALINKIRSIDAIFFTHHHADHMYGLSDVRGINRIIKKSIDCFLHASTLEVMQRTFYFIFSSNLAHQNLYASSPHSDDRFYQTCINPILINYFKKFYLNNNKIEVTPTLQDHGSLDSAK